MEVPFKLSVGMTGNRPPLRAATPLSSALGGQRATAAPNTPSSWGSPARRPLRFPGELRAGIRETQASAEDRGACWGGTITVSSEANVAGPENGSRMERSPSYRAWGPRPGARTRSSKLRLPPLPRCPPLLLHQCRKCSTDLHIFPNIRDLFFFFSPLWEETGENPKKKKREEAGAVRARKQGGIQQGSRKQRTQTRAHKQSGEPEAAVATSAGLRDRVGWERKTTRPGARNGVPAPLDSRTPVHPRRQGRSPKEAIGSPSPRGHPRDITEACCLAQRSAPSCLFQMSPGPLYN